jgi:ribosomal protein S18 acetylase RimI-like enzyme
MTAGVTFRSDAASPEQLAALLQRCDASFVPPLSNRVGLGAYARKIASHALRLEAWEGSEPVALLAMYCNDLDSGVAYITSVSVVPDHAGRGIASALLSEAIRRARTAGMRRIALEVDAANGGALRLYQKHGFEATSSGPSIRMSLNLPAKDEHDQGTRL